MTRARLRYGSVAICCWLSGFAAGPVPAAADASSAREPMSLRDTLGFREVREIALAPSGAAVAYVVRHADLAARRNVDRLVWLEVATRRERTLFTGEEISRIAWSPDESFVYGTARDEGRATVFRSEAGTGGAVRLWSAPAPFGGFAVSPDGTCCLVTVTEFAGAGSLEEPRDRGAVFQWGRHSYEDVTLPPRPEPVRENFVRIPTGPGSVAVIGGMDFAGIRPGEFVRNLAIAPNNRYAVVQVRRAGDPTRGGPPSNFDLVLLEVETGTVRKVMPGSLQTEQGAIWLGNSEWFFFVSDGRGQVYEVATGRVSPIEWVKTPIDWLQGGVYDAAAQTLVLHLRGSLLRLNLAKQQEETVPGIFATPSFSADHRRYAFLAESPGAPPEVAIAEAAGGPQQVLTHLNPELDRRALARVERIAVTNAYGTKSTAFLVWPVGYEEGRLYPLIVASYGFRGRFLTVAEWHTTFPVQTLAGQGYAVLLANLPALKSAQQLAGDPVKAREHEGWQVLSTLESAIGELIGRGLADPDRLGLYGWSHGAFVTEFMLAHSRLHFRAACVGEGGDYNPGEYWLFGTASWPRIFANTFGGPLTAGTAAAYLEFSPVLSVDRVKTPLLLEFRRETGMLGFEFYVPLRMLGVPAELVTYADEEHNFVRPTVRLASMERKVDWFNYWMLDRIDPAPAKAGQFHRWQGMKEAWVLQAKDRGADDGPPSGAGN